MTEEEIARREAIYRGRDLVDDWEELKHILLMVIFRDHGHTHTAPGAIILRHKQSR